MFLLSTVKIVYLYSKVKYVFIEKYKGKFINVL